MNKYIVTHQCAGTWYSNGYVIPDYHDHSLAAYESLYQEVVKSFPDVKQEDVCCRTVVASRWCKNMPIIIFPLPANTTAEGWISRNEFLPDVICL